MEEIRSWP
jgi:hypothetical protein